MLQESLGAAGYPERILVACSGGPDSLALAAAAAHFGRRGHVDGHPVSVGAVVVDHQLQPGSAGVAAAAAATLRDLGLSPVHVKAVEVASTGVGPEAAARDARHAALNAAAAEDGAGAILLGHTLDDQAEQVLLGLARGSGTRSLAGMRPARDKLLRPFLGLRRADTLAICAAEGLEPWHDPSNVDPAFARSRTRVEVLPLLEQKLGPGVAESLARTAAILQLDADYLEDVANDTFLSLREQSGTTISLPEEALRGLAPAIRFRVIAKAAAAVGGQQPSYQRLLAAEALLRRRGSAGPVELAGGVNVYRLPLVQLLAEGPSGPGSVPRGAARCGKLVFRPQKPPQI
ncbi:tRNA lysidine(34) synthetase TilS [Arthrobacter sp. AL08]|uniref:tRNA lysidine(34) synthetase TilS n=1 Tax=Micrococcaceae TaxID=1268 RepID=UPI001CFFD019|nr:MULTISPECIES: tRNA lysidine(34) synthetase TilS [Micrococcaceae]MCB5281152.1 tRNA(Ile)-lysidine synthase [Arthrobacter sp. ES1]MDI3240915.1 tRNA lysidine(34) synthetase TilS [Arthrobacter sp. AL05]MDI3277109.1 tRNA lysidine(34) synthetase TilS [Arthrobacter sp. AL08]MDJ0352358.1 tRNA lysidine(34) synthetase TilS [Pseudarthrobacter sp. PH31-O2]WGZ81461.1 tRNA lysidine(34) synthetase TilS [Arthrobacter sp. EM1]